MLAGPQPATRTRKKQFAAGRQRAQTDYKKHAQQKAAAQTQSQPQTQTQPDDLLDLFGMSTTNNNENKSNNDNDNGNPFGDPFGDFGFANDGNDDVQPKKKKKKKKTVSTTTSTATSSSTPNKEKRSRTVTGPPSQQNANPNSNSNANPNGGKKPVKKMKKIDVLPLLHKGVRANKFKLNGNKSKVRTFYVTANNFYFCWEAVGQQHENKGGGIFGKVTGQSGRSKVDKDRSIPVRTIRSLQKNPAYMMQSYNFIPPQQKALTLTIVYNINGQDKKLNFMAYEPFHHQLLYDGMKQLIDAARDPKRNLAEVFELYVDFPKEILPKHLRPQRFKWEPLGDSDYNANDKEKDKEKDDENNLFFDNSHNSFQNVDVYDPTSIGQFGRSRIKSF